MSNGLQLDSFIDRRTTHFMPLVSFNPFREHQRTRGFLMFLGDIEREQRYEMQKQPFRGVLRERCSENMQQIYKWTSIPKSDLIAILFKSHFGMGVLHIFRTPFLNNLRTPTKGYFWKWVNNKFLLPPCIVPFPNLFFSFYLFCVASMIQNYVYIFST